MVESCEHPKRIRNPYTNEIVYVPCRECDVCKYRRASEWTTRLEVERKAHKYCLFVTLTHAPKFRPLLVEYGDYLVDESAGLFIEKSELEKCDYYEEYYQAYNGIPYLRFQDAQKFIKRLRQVVLRNPSTEQRADRYIRYYICGEYGETSFLPHFHALIFTSSEWLATYAKDVISRCWSTDNRYSHSEQLGRVDCEVVKYTASAYVSAYLNIPSNLPVFYRTGALRPRAIFSRHPPIGSLLTSEKEIQSLFDSGSVTAPLFKSESNQLVDSPLPKSIYSRLYPKVPRFTEFSDECLSAVYSLADCVKGFSYRTFEDFIRKRYESVDRVYSQYFSPFFHDKDQFCYYKANESLCTRLFSVLRRVAYQSDSFGVSIPEYTRRILKFYKDFDYYKLKTQVQDEVTLSTSLGGDSTLLVDRDFIDQVKRNNYQVNYDQLLILKSYAYDEECMSVSDFITSVESKRALQPDWIDKVSKAKKFNSSYKKKRVKYEYLSKDKRLPIDLKNVLIKIHKNG